MIYPAIDLMDGGCVRLYKGDFNQRTNYDDQSPQDVVKAYADAGAKWVHIVDLDGAKNGKAAQTELIMELAQIADIKVQTGGGIRDQEQIQKLLAGGVARVVVGSLAVSNPQMVKYWISEVGQDKICIALDVEFDEAGVPFPTLRGWTEKSERNLWEVMEDYMGTGLRTMLVTDISKDGVLGGANEALYKQIRTEYPSIDLITSGGVGSLDHVRSLKGLDPYGIIIGKALYENKFTLEQAIKCRAARAS